jgi:hypothetical protein
MFFRSLASRGELLPIYNKAREKSLELENIKKGTDRCVNSMPAKISLKDHIHGT